jgi:hypothetical protein
VIGTAPEGKLEEASDLLPGDKLLDLDTETEVVRVKKAKLSHELLNYLRSVLMPNFQGHPEYS